MATPAENTTATAASVELAEFLAELKTELNAGRVELPSYPDLSLQIQRILRDENVSMEKVVRLVGSEPVLAGRVMQLASSAALNPRNTPILELRTAVSRLGFDSLRAAAVSFAMLQLRLAPSYQGVQASLAQLWRENAVLSATACVVARRCRRISPDAAMFAGLVAGVGRICLLAKTRRHPALANDAAAYHAMVLDWHAEVAQAVLRGWGIAEDIRSAVYALHRRSSLLTGASALRDVLQVAELLAFNHDVPELMIQQLRDEQAAARLGMEPMACLQLMNESQAELALLRSALGQ